MGLTVVLYQYLEHQKHISIDGERLSSPLRVPLSVFKQSLMKITNMIYLPCLKLKQGNAGGGGRGIKLWVLKDVFRHKKIFSSKFIQFHYLNNEPK